jgi:alpha-glucosidase
MLAAALPGSLYIYQGEELGLDEVEDLPEHQRQDPMHVRSGGTDPGRDGCRVPLPWSGVATPFGFSPSPAAQEPWLRQPEHWADLTVEAQDGDPGSTLNLYRDALRIRHGEAGLGDGPMTWLSAPDRVLAFARGDRFVSMTNLSAAPVRLPADAVVLLASADISGAVLPPDVSAWLHLERPVGGSRPSWPSGGVGMG